MRTVTLLFLLCCFTTRISSQIIFDDNGMRKKMLWLSGQGKDNLHILTTYLEECDLLGLEASDYKYDLLLSVSKDPSQLKGLEDSVSADQEITMAALKFFHAVAYGKEAPRLAYNGITGNIIREDLSEKLYKSLQEGTFNLLLEEVEPACSEYKAIKQMIAQYVAQDTTEPAPVTSYLVDSTNHPLITRLYRLGYLDSLHDHLPEMFIRDRLRKAQHLFELYADGGLRPAVFEALNVPLKERIRQLKQSLNVFRWLNGYRNSKKIIVVNIPAANLFCWLGDSILLSSRIVVGKRATPTPTLSSSVKELIMYPYWTVPYKIATKELLPAIRDNIPYLEAGNYQVLDKQGNILNPYDINWKVLGPKNFPYTIRQANGCDNSLGIMKLNFFNPYDVYLHDTPWKNFFFYNQRYFSHGCMRVEEAIALAKLVMPERAGEIDALSDCKKSPIGKPIVMKLKDPVPVFVLYQVAWPDEKGTIRFFKDVYGR